MKSDSSRSNEHCFLPTHSFSKTSTELLASHFDFLNVFGEPSVKHLPVGSPKLAKEMLRMIALGSVHSSVTFSCSAAETQPRATDGGGGPEGPDDGVLVKRSVPSVAARVIVRAAGTHSQTVAHSHR